MGLFRKPIDVDVAPLVRSNSRVLRVAVASDCAPHSFVNKEGQLSGMDIEILYNLASRMQRKPKFFTGDCPTCRKMMQDGEVDVLSGFDIYSNMPGVIKTIPTSADTMQVFGKKPVNHVSQLSGKRVAIMKNSVLMTAYDFNCTYVEYPTNTSILAAVEGGDVDYGISHGAVAQDIIQKNHFNIKPGLILLGSYPAFGISSVLLRNRISTPLMLSSWISSCPVWTALRPRRPSVPFSRVDALTIPIIAVTANTYQDIEDEVHAAGMNACLSKPVHTKALIAALEQYKL